MNTMTINSYVAFVGIDWADTKHDVCIQAVHILLKPITHSGRRRSLKLV